MERRQEVALITARPGSERLLYLLGHFILMIWHSLKTNGVINRIDCYVCKYDAPLLLLSRRSGCLGEIDDCAADGAKGTQRIGRLRAGVSEYHSSIIPCACTVCSYVNISAYY